MCLSLVIDRHGLHCFDIKMDLVSINRSRDRSQNSKIPIAGSKNATVFHQDLLFQSLYFRSSDGFRRFNLLQVA
jgi:hypothetical protein